MQNFDTITFSPFTDMDLAELRSLHALSFSRLASGEHSVEQVHAHIRFMQSDDYATDVARSNVFCARDADGNLLATGGWLKMDVVSTTARIRKVFVHPQRARTGLGRHMVELAERTAQQSGCTDFFVRANINAKGFYSRLGYRDIKPGTMPVDGGVNLPVMFMHKD